MERTLVIVKPDAVQRGLAGVVLARMERLGLKIVGMKMLHISRDLAHQHYAEHVGKPFFEGLVAHITSCPVILAVVEGPGAVRVVRKAMGETNPQSSAMGTIRGDLALSMDRNLIHGSDAPETATREISLFFKPEELYAYSRAVDAWVFGNE